jgi:hypothetical protein
MTTEWDTIRIQLNYPLELVQEPILYELIMQFGLIPNIRRANFDWKNGGFIFLELSGERHALESALVWLQERGITISGIGLDGTQEWAI